MSNLAAPLVADLLNPASAPGALLLGGLVLTLALLAIALVRRFARRVGQHLSDVTALGFTSALAQLLICLLALTVYAHLVPELRGLGTALLASASVVSVIVGLAAKDTLGNLVAGLFLVVYRQVRVGDTIRLTAAGATVVAKVRVVSLGFTILVADDASEVIVPNNVMIGSTIIRVRQVDQHTP